jgi:hypothetical protein
MCHLVLIHRSLGTEGANPEEEERILEQYTRYLMESDKLGKYHQELTIWIKLKAECASE